MVDALIENNIMHLCPCSSFPYDIKAEHAEYPIVNAHLPRDLMIMKEFLRLHKYG